MDTASGCARPGKWSGYASTLVSVERGWSEFNPTVNDLGFTMGLNDNFSYDRAADKIEAQTADDFTRLSSSLPNARIVVVEPF